MPPSATPSNISTASTSTVRRNPFRSHISQRRAEAASAAQGPSIASSFSGTTTTSNSATSSSTTLPNPTSSTTATLQQHPSPTTTSLPSYSTTNLSANPNPDTRRPKSSATIPTYTRSHSASSSASTLPAMPLFLNDPFLTSPTQPVNTDIITRDRSGRPDLPHIPLLPAHLRLGRHGTNFSGHHGSGAGRAGGGAGGAGSGDEGNDDDGTPETEDAEGIELASAMQEKEDQERIERSLVDMVYRSRVRGNAGLGGFGHHPGMGAGAAGGPVAAGFGPDNEELLALVQASLRKKVARLEEDRWMFEGDGDGEVR